MEKTEYEKWLDGRLIDYSAIGELSWVAALNVLLERVSNHPSGSLTKGEIASIVASLIK